MENQTKERRMIFDIDVYNMKKQFIQRCMKIPTCAQCSKYDKKEGCQDPGYIKKRLLRDIDLETDSSLMEKANRVSCSFDHAHGKFRMRLNNRDLGQKTVAFCVEQTSTGAIMEFVRKWPKYIGDEAEYSRMKNRLDFYRRENNLR